jgi:hypothetical protein
MAAFSLRSRKIDLEKIGAIPVVWGELPDDELEMTRDLPELGTGMDWQEERVRLRFVGVCLPKYQRGNFQSLISPNFVPIVFTLSMRLYVFVCTFPTMLIFLKCCAYRSTALPFRPRPRGAERGSSLPSFPIATLHIFHSTVDIYYMVLHVCVFVGLMRTSPGHTCPIRPYVVANRRPVSTHSRKCTCKRNSLKSPILRSQYQ